nr:MAG TPA: hypothetical protein [Caudoviricetes sp.]
MVRSSCCAHYILLIYNYNIVCRALRFMSSNSITKINISIASFILPEIFPCLSL